MFDAEISDRDTEKAIAAKLVDLILERGYAVSVYDGETYQIGASKDRAEIIAAMGSTDEDAIIAIADNGKRVATFLLIWGNGIDLLSDYGVNPIAEAIADAHTEYVETTFPDA